MTKPLIYDIDDGHDTTDWIKKQDWYDGKIGMIGGSYFGYTQWETALNNPDVTCMVPIFTSPNMFKMVINGGALEYIMVEGWLAGMKAQVEDSEHLLGRVDESLGNVSDRRIERRCRLRAVNDHDHG